MGDQSMMVGGKKLYQSFIPKELQRGIWGAIFTLACFMAVVCAEQLPLSQPPGYIIRTPAIPFTAEDVLSQPPQQYLSPDLSGVVGVGLAPVQQYITPEASAAAAVPLVPTQQYISPDLSAVASPVDIYQEPLVVTHSQGFAAADNQVPAQYDFSYSVEAFDENSNKVEYGHNEKRDGTYTTGSYHVLLPDTRMMRVEYYADETGFHPVYTFEGEALFSRGSIQQHQPSQLYTQPGRK